MIEEARESEARPDPLIPDAAALLGSVPVAIAQVLPDGRLVARTSAMAALVSEFESSTRRQIRRLDDLPFDDSERSTWRSLAARASPSSLQLRVGAEARGFRVDLQPLPGGGYAAVFVDTTRLQRAEAEVLRLARLRALATVAEGLAHDVKNVLGATLAVAEFLAPVVQDQESQHLLEAARTSATEGAAVLGLLLQMLRRRPETWQVSGIEDLVDDAVRLFTKTARLSENDVRVQVMPDPPRVRVISEDVAYLILQLLVWSRAAVGPGAPIEIEVGSTDQVAAPGAIQRRFGRVRVANVGSEAERLVSILHGPETGLLQGGLGGPGPDLLGAAIGILRLGGDLQCERRNGRVWASLLLPAAMDR